MLVKYTHEQNKFAAAEGFEPSTLASKVLRSIQLRYAANNVPQEGLEPSHPRGHQILSLARLPIPPSGHMR